MDGRGRTVIFTVYHIFFAFSIRKSFQREKTGVRPQKNHNLALASAPVLCIIGGDCPAAKRTSKRNLNLTAINLARRPFLLCGDGTEPRCRRVRYSERPAPPRYCGDGPQVKKGRLMEKYSVKKPFTVLVAVLIVFLMGFVSVTNLRTDLLPEMSTQIGRASCRERV